MSDNVPNPLSVNEVEFSTYYKPVSDEVELFIMEWRPVKPVHEEALIFIPGLVSVVDGWADFLKAMVRIRPVFYIESREKRSARIKPKWLRPADFSIKQFAQDLIAVWGELPLTLERAVVAGSSLGATSIVEALKHSQRNPRAAFLIGPNSEFKGPLPIKALLFLPAPLYYVIKYVILWYLRTFRVDTKKEPEQWARYNATLRSAQPLRLKMTARSAIRYEIWSDLETVSIPVGIAYATSDTLHAADNIRRLEQTMPRATLIPCSSNKYMHTAALVQDIEKFITELVE
ncbi:alpha/beta fold hydrolase [candidate division CSSED10-310 bacterium]|uniref:Alpha/beta fold hydrolase n=1 Tax=candidate division CSSED10-310 bacterium TaxID=2855610 RepID=A0ABV6YTA2_UNCC1